MDISLQPQARLFRRAGSSSSSATRCTTVTCDGRHPLRRCARSRRSRPTSPRTSRTRSRSCTASSTTTSTCCTCCSPSSRMSAPMPPRYTPPFRNPPSLHPLASPLPCTPLHPPLHSPAPPHPSMHIAPHVYLQTLNAQDTRSHSLTHPHTPSHALTHTLTHPHTLTHIHTHSHTLTHTPHSCASVDTPTSQSAWACLASLHRERSRRSLTSSSWAVGRRIAASCSRAR